MIASLLMLICALLLSSIAGFYSVIGMTAIFSASFVPVLLMTGGLEAAKVITASWLYNNWRKTPLLLRTYLTAAVIILMFITSLGIFGFLSKAHIEQTGAAREGVARLEIIDSEIQRQKDIVTRGEAAIKEAETKGTTGDAEIQAQIDKEQSRIDSVNARMQPAIDEQNAIIAKEEQRLGGGISLLQDQIKTVDGNLAKLDQYLTENNIRMAQGLVGAPVDGRVGGKTSKAIAAYRAAQQAEKQRLVAKVTTEQSKLASPVIDAARAEIKRLRANSEQEVADSMALVVRLRGQLGKAAGTVDVNKVVSTETPKIDAATAKINSLTEEKYALEANARRLEVEVGPIKYVAQLIYGDSINDSLLERAVRWVIILIISVFDPMAVLMLIAANQGLNEWRADMAARWRERRKRGSATAPAPVAGPTVAEAPVTEAPAVANTRDDNGRLDELAGQIGALASMLSSHMRQAQSATDAPSPRMDPLPIREEQATAQQDMLAPRQPVVEDAITSPDDIVLVANQPVQPDRVEWQLIDRLPDVQPTAEAATPQDAPQHGDLPASTDELFDGLASRHDAAMRDRQG